MYRGCTLDTDGMSAAEAAKLRSLVAESGVTSLTDMRILGNDLRRLTIHVDGEGMNHSVSFDAPAMPERLLPLVSYLRGHARDLLNDLPQDPPASQ